MSENNGLFIAATVTKIILLILNTLGNLLVIQAIARSHRLRTASNYLVANLALCDLLSPLLNIPVDISVDIAGDTWLYGTTVCKLVWPSATLFTISSALTLVTISIDRSRALRHPFVTKLTTRQSLALIFLTHAFSFIVIVPYAMASVVRDGKCREDWSSSHFQPRQYTLIVFHVQYLVPLIILAFVYSKAAHYLYRCTKNLVLLELDGRSRHSENSTVAHFLRRHRRFRGIKKTAQRSRGLKIRGEQNARVVKMFAIVVAVFAIFTLPNNVRWLLTDFGNYSEYEHRKIISFLCVTCTYANCLANPIIYGTLSRDYKSHFMRILTVRRNEEKHDLVHQRPRGRPTTPRKCKRSLNDGHAREIITTMV